MKSGAKPRPTDHKSAAFVVSEAKPGATSDQDALEPPPPDVESLSVARPRLRLRLARGPGLSVLLRIRAPGAGVVDARALSRVHGRHGESGSRKSPVSTLVSARRRLDAAGETRMTLRPKIGFRRATAHRRLPLRLLVSFAPATGGARLTVSRTITLTTPGHSSTR